MSGRAVGVKAAGLLAAMVATALAGCGGREVTNATIGRVVVRFRTTVLGVGDTMTVGAGVLFADGRYAPFSGVTVTSQTPQVLAVRPGTTIVEGVQGGTAALLVDVESLATPLDTVVAVAIAVP